MTLAVEIFKVRIAEIEQWPAREIVEYEAYYLLKERREQKEREQHQLGSGQGRRTPGPVRRGRGRR